VIKKYVPDARITFGKKKMMDTDGKLGLPWLVSGKRAEKDFGFKCMPWKKRYLSTLTTPAWKPASSDKG